MADSKGGPDDHDAHNPGTTIESGKPRGMDDHRLFMFTVRGPDGKRPACRSLGDALCAMRRSHRPGHPAKPSTAPADRYRLNFT